MACSSRLTRELEQVELELGQVDSELSRLRQRRSKLLERKEQIKASLHVDAASSAADWEAETFAWSNMLRQQLTATFGLANFRPLQLSAMNAVLSGRDALLVMSTGGGKSLCYQLPSLVNAGIALVISPLISLMEDQLLALDKLNFSSAAMFSQSCSKEQVQNIQNRMLDARSDLKLVYAAPEKLAKSKRFMAKLEKVYELKRLRLIAVDEVHCCSQWGHDFRPDYKFLNVLKRQFRGVPILGLTATATAKVLDDVKSILSIPGALVFRAGFNRPNLRYEVRQKSADTKEFLNDLSSLILNRFRDQSGIIYCFSKRESEELALQLRGCGVKALPYHADVLAAERSRVHVEWTKGNCSVIVATVAFGMGIDKANVRFVIHQTMAKSLENYYQESGRAGRDEQLAHCILYFRFGDVFRLSTIVCTEQCGLENLYAMVAYSVNGKECRRKLIAEHFGEDYAPEWCSSAGCDVCSVGKESRLVPDFAVEARALLALLSEKSAADTKMTALKLADTVTQVAKKKEPNFSRLRNKSSVEKLIVELLLESYLREDFHFTPYNIISYIAVGSRKLSDGDQFLFNGISAELEENLEQPKRKKLKPM